MLPLTAAVLPLPLHPPARPPARPRCRRFNFAGCSAGDLVSHYIKPQQHLCMWAAKGSCRRC